MNTKIKTPILLIEDNLGDANLVKLKLKDASIKHDLFHAETLFEGIELIQNNRIDLVLIDLTLPDSSGFKTLSNFREKVPNIPVIVLTSTNNEIVGNQAIKAGAQDFLVKGQFDGKLLGRSIRYALQRYSIYQKMQESAIELSISEKRYVEAQEMAHFGNWEMDIVSNEMKWTDEVYRIFGLQPNSFQPTLSEYLNYVQIEDRELVENFFDQAAKDGKVHQIEHRIRVDGSAIKFVALRCKVYFEEITDKILLVGVIQDISERKLNEQLIIDQNFAKGTSKMTQQALTDMGFHIRTPLSSIVNLLYLLETTKPSNQQQEFVEGLKTSVDDLSIVLNNLLNFSIIANENLQIEGDKFKLKDFLQSTQKVIQIKADNADLKLNFNIGENLPEQCIGDLKKLNITLYNIISFAIQHAQTNGQVNVDTNLIILNEKEATLAFKVADNGPGMNSSRVKELMQSEKLLEVYDPEQSADENADVNIAIVLRLINIMEGTFKIESQEGERTTYNIEIPIKVVRQMAINEENKPNSPVKLLLVEDHFLNQIATKKVLKAWSDMLTIDIAENGLVAVEKFREHGYDLILMDLQMPVMDGIEAASKIREKSQVPIIALTANSTKQEQDRCAKVGINDYLSKPFKPQELYAKIMNLLASVAETV